MRAPEGVHPWADAGFSRAATAYDRARPSYPAAAVSFLAEELRLRAGATVVDIGAGTGKLARLLLGTGARVVAVEPVRAMRELIPPGIDALEGSAEAIPLADGAVDAVVVAQAFHWFRPEALPEIQRTLRRDGRLAVVQNRRDTGDALQRVFEETLERHRAHASIEREPRLDPHLFRVVGSASFRNDHDLDAADLVALAASETSIAVLEDAAHSAALGDFTRLASTLPQRVRLRYTTEVVVAETTCSSSAP